VVGEFVAHDSRLRFGSVNHGQYDAINGEAACPKLLTRPR
jgi:hypothetical protein